MANLKSEVDKLEQIKNVVKNDVFKKTVYNKLVAKIDNIDTSDSVLKTKYDTDKSEFEIKFLIPVVLLKRLITILKLLK